MKHKQTLTCAPSNGRYEWRCIWNLRGGRAGACSGFTGYHTRSGARLDNSRAEGLQLRKGNAKEDESVDVVRDAVQFISIQVDTKTDTEACDPSVVKSRDGSW